MPIPHALLDAVEHGSAVDVCAHILSRMVEDGLDIGRPYPPLSETNERGAQLLHIAASRGVDAGIVQVLTMWGASCEARDARGDAPCHIAAAGGHTACMLALLQGMDVNVRDARERTCLHIVASHGDADSARALLSSGADACARDASGDTPLFCAVMSRARGVAALVTALLDAGAARTVNEVHPLFYLTVLHQAIQFRAYTCVRALLRVAEPAIDVTKTMGETHVTPLHLAAHVGDVRTLRELLRHDACRELVTARDALGRTPLHTAAQYARVACVNALLRVTLRDDVDTMDFFGYTPLMRCASSAARVGGSRAIMDVARALLAAGADVGVRTLDDRTVLHMACERTARGGARLVRFLLRAGAHAGAHDVRGRSPVHEAAAHGHARILRVLATEYHCDVNEVAATEGGFGVTTPLHEACGQGDAHAIARLLAHGARVDARADGGRTPLHVAATHCDEDGVRLLLKHGACASAFDDAGNTPIHLAAGSIGTSRDTLTALLSAVGDEEMEHVMNALNNEGASVLSCATAYAHRTVSPLIRTLLDVHAAVPHDWRHGIH